MADLPRVPKSFRLLHRRWVVRVVTTKQLQRHLDLGWNAMNPDEPPLEAKGIKGITDPNADRLFLNKDEHSTEADLFHTFCHEMVHVVKFANGEYGHDEEEVDRLGGFIAHILATLKF